MCKILDTLVFLFKESRGQMGSTREGYSWLDWDIVGKYRRRKGSDECTTRGFVDLLSEQTAIDLPSTQQMPFSLQTVGDSENRCVCVCLWGERRMCFWQFSWLRCRQWGGGGRKLREKKSENWVGDKMIYGRCEGIDKWQPKYQKIAGMGAEEK